MRRGPSFVSFICTVPGQIRGYGPTTTARALFRSTFRTVLDVWSIRVQVFWDWRIVLESLPDVSKDVAPVPWVGPTVGLNILDKRFTSCSCRDLNRWSSGLQLGHCTDWATHAASDVVFQNIVTFSKCNYEFQLPYCSSNIDYVMVSFVRIRETLYR